MPRSSAYAPVRFTVDRLKGMSYKMGREIPLFYLLASEGRLSRLQVSQLADELYEDACRGRTRSLLDVARRVGLLKAGHHSDDAFLKHAGLRYSREDMEKDASFYTRVQRPDEPVRTIADTWAGIGHARPVLKDMYGLWVVRYTEDTPLQGTEQEIFIPTPSCVAHKRAIQDNLNFTEWPEYPVLLVFGEVGLTEEGPPDLRKVAVA